MKYGRSTLSFNQEVFLIAAVLLFLALLPNASAEGSGHILVDIREHGKIISYYDEFYVVQVGGRVTFYNGYNATLFDIIMPVNLPYLSLFELDNTSYFRGKSFYFLQFAPFETKTIDFEIRGVTPTDPISNNMSVLRTAMFNMTPTMYASIRTLIEKGPIEDTDINTTRIKSIKNRRLITAILENPSDSIYNISKVDIIKTNSEDITNEMKRWTYPEDGDSLVLGAYDTWKKDILDYNCTDGEVYWISVDIAFDVHSYVNGTHNIAFFNQEELELINKTLNESEIYGNVTSYLEHLLFMRKSYSQTSFFPGDDVNVEIKVNNFAPIAREVNVTDFIPFGFRVTSPGDANYSSNATLLWNVHVNPDSSRLLAYTMEYYDKDSLGLDFFEPAILKYTNETFYSQRISFVRQYIPEKKIFIQKKLRSTINDEYVVTLKIQNLGESMLSDIYIKEFLDAGSQFREITVAPSEKGMWAIPELKKNDVWEVSYITDDNPALTTLPTILGVQNSVVLKTLIFEQTIRNAWVKSTVRIMEKIGIGVLIAIPILLFILNRRQKMKLSGRGGSNFFKRDSESRAYAKGSQQSAVQQVPPSAKPSVSSLEASATRPNIQPQQPQQPLSSAEQDQNQKSGYYMFSTTTDSMNREEAHQNIDELKKMHNDVGHQGDRV